MNVLYITYGLPYPPHSGARVRDFFLLREIAKRHPVTGVCLLEHPKETKYIPALEQLGIRPYGFAPEQQPFIAGLRAVAHHIAQGRPLATFAFWNARMFEWVRELATTTSFDIVQLEHSFLTPYVHALPPCLRAKTILDLHNIGALQYQSMLQLDLNPRERAEFWLKQALMRNWEARAAERFARVLTVSSAEANWLRAQNSMLQVEVVENGVDVEQCAFLPEAAHGNTLLFVGTLGYRPNIDGIRWFCERVLPHVRHAVPDVSLEIVGRAPRAGVQALAQYPAVRVSADVDDLTRFYQAARLAIVPLRAGGGTRLKVLEAMAYGRAVVSTSIGCEGLEVRDKENILIANSPQEFAACVIHLLQDHSTRERIAHRARELVEAQYGWTRLGAKLMRIYDELVPKAV